MTFAGNRVAGTGTGTAGAMACGIGGSAGAGAGAGAGVGADALGGVETTGGGGGACCGAGMFFTAITCPVVPLPFFAALKESLFRSASVIAWVVQCFATDFIPAR